ncbi:MAG: hypothetical protein MZW92_78635 [Comamonadaceae bacterium]|nr:hypothetical protein [Comamonadaceae bacterium]
MMVASGRPRGGSRLRATIGGAGGDPVGLRGGPRPGHLGDTGARGPRQGGRTCPGPRSVTRS